MTYSTSASNQGSLLVNNSLVSGAVPLVGRILIAAIFLFSGVSKLITPGASIAYIEMAGLPLPIAAYGAAVVLELVGAVALVIGFQARLAALGLALFTVVAAFGFHFNLADQNQFIHFFKNVAMVGGLLQVAAFGAGGYSLDGRR